MDGLEIGPDEPVPVAEPAWQPVPLPRRAKAHSLRRTLATWLAGVLAGAVLAGAGGVYAGVSWRAADELTQAHHSWVDDTQITDIDPNATLDQVNVSFPSRTDHLTLRGWLFQHPGTLLADRRVIVIVNGWTESRTGDGFPDLQRGIYGHGYDVLMYDTRASGESDGDRVTFGATEYRDVLGAYDFLRKNGYDPSHMGFLGFSLGGISVLRASPEMPRVAIAVDSTFADTRDAILRGLDQMSGLPGIFDWGIETFGALGFGVDLDARPVDAIAAQQRRPLLIMGGDRDLMANAPSNPTAQEFELLHASASEPDRLASDRAVRLDGLTTAYTAAGAPDRRLVLFHGAGHGGEASVDRGVWSAQLFAFFDTQLGVAGS